MYKPIKWKYSVKMPIIPRLWVLEEIRNYNKTQIIHRVWVMYNFILWEYYGKNKYISILWVLTKNLLNQKTHKIPRYGKLVPIDFLMYGNFFFQFMEKRWEYPYLFHPWILRDFTSVYLVISFSWNWYASVDANFFFPSTGKTHNLVADTQASGHNPNLATKTQFNDRNPNLATEIFVFQYQVKQITGIQIL